MSFSTMSFNLRVMQYDDHWIGSVDEIPEVRYEGDSAKDCAMGTAEAFVSHIEALPSLDELMRKAHDDWLDSRK